MHRELHCKYVISIGGIDAVSGLWVFLFGMLSKAMEGNKTEQRALIWAGPTPAVLHGVLYTDVSEQKSLCSSVDVSVSLEFCLERNKILT